MDARANTGLSVQQRFRIAKAQSQRLLARPTTKDAHSDWMDECVPTLMDRGKDQTVAIAACMNMWRDAWEQSHPDGADDPGPDRKQLLRFFDEAKHPRDEDGKWTSGGAGDSHPGEGYSKHAYVRDGVIHTSDVHDAARALHDNRKVELEQPRGVSILLNRLGEISKDMIAKGEKAPNYNLCNVTIRGTSLFCADNKGIPRVEMPQLKKEQDAAFMAHLQAKGYKIERQQQYASHLRATQNELNGAKVASLAKYMREHDFGGNPIFVSNDDYILDGHHRWAAEIGNDAIDNVLGNDKKMAIMRVDISITKLLEEADAFTGGANKVSMADEPARPKAMQGAGASDAAFAKIEAAVAAIPAEHAAKIAHVPVLLTKTSDEFPSHIAAGGGSSTVGLFSWKNDQPRIDIAEAIKMGATITSPGPGGTSQSVKTETLLPIRQPEQVTVHELAHAYDYANGWAPSAEPALIENFAAAVTTMTESEASNANYWISGGQREMFAELYSAIYNPNRDSNQTYFGGMALQRVHEVFAHAIPHLVTSKQFDVVRRVNGRPPSSMATGWFVNDDGHLYALLNGMPYEVDVAGTPFANLQLVPGTYANDAALIAAAQTRRKAWFLARAQARRILAKKAPWNEADHPRDPGGEGGGQFVDAGGGSGTSSGKGKGKYKKAKKEDFDKAGISFGRLSEGGSDAAKQEAEQKFIERWNDKIGIEPAEFKQQFLGGNEGTMVFSASYGTKLRVNGQLKGTGKNEGLMVGSFTREIDIDGKSAYSEYFKLEKVAQKSAIGKKMLAGNVEMYEQLGIEKVSVTANIDVGGYAWAKYGYVPTQDSWNSLRAGLERKLTGGSSSAAPTRGENTIEADSWEMLSSETQDEVRNRWKNDTHSEFLSSEEQNWRESGQALGDAKSMLADNFVSAPEWAVEAINKSREDRKEAGLPDIPYSNDQLFGAISIEYENDGEGRNDPKIEFDDDYLKQPQGYDEAQGTLPGIEPIDPATYLTEAMRDELTTDLMNAFNDKAEEDAQEIDPPSYLAESVDEYQDEYWDQKSDREKLQHAIDMGLADIEIEPEEDEEDDEPQMDLPAPAPAQDPLLAAVRSSNPKSIWVVADSPRGKELLLKSGWSGVLNLKDKESMERFKEYVGRAAYA